MGGGKHTSQKFSNTETQDSRRDRTDGKGRAGGGRVERKKRGSEGRKEKEEKGKTRRTKKGRREEGEKKGRNRQKKKGNRKKRKRKQEKKKKETGKTKKKKRNRKKRKQKGNRKKQKKEKGHFLGVSTEIVIHSLVGLNLPLCSVQLCQHISDHFCSQSVQFTLNFSLYIGMCTCNQLMILTCTPLEWLKCKKDLSSHVSAQDTEKKDKETEKKKKRKQEKSEKETAKTKKKQSRIKRDRMRLCFRANESEMQL